MNSMQRILHITQMLKSGEKLTVDQLCTEFNKHRETIKRDLRIIRNSVENEGSILVYDHHHKTYELQLSSSRLSTAQIYTMLAVLHGTRALNNEEFSLMEDNMTQLLPSAEKKQLQKLLTSFRYHYKAATSDPMLHLIGEILESIRTQTALDIVYINAKKEEKHMRIAPYTLVFDENYFYVISRIINQTEENLYNLRVDRIAKYAWTTQKFTVNQSGNDFFKPGEYANIAAKMYSGDRLIKIKLRVQHEVTSYFEDKFPVHTLLAKTKSDCTYEFIVMNDEGALYWILSQRDRVEVLEPAEVRTKIHRILTDTLDLYK